MEYKTTPPKPRVQKHEFSLLENEITEILKHFIPKHLVDKDCPTFFRETREPFPDDDSPKRRFFRFSVYEGLDE